jgi:hypothetical protein
MEQVDERLADAGLTPDAVMAETLAQNLGAIGLIDSMIASAEAHRTNMLCEIEHHREALSSALGVPSMTKVCTVSAT